MSGRWSLVTGVVPLGCVLVVAVALAVHHAWGPAIFLVALSAVVAGVVWVLRRTGNRGQRRAQAAMVVIAALVVVSGIAGLLLHLWVQVFYSAAALACFGAAVFDAKRRGRL